MKDRHKNEQTELLFRALLSVETEKECAALFADLCTYKEVEEMSRRLWAAKRLSEGKIYTDIASETGLSTATISRVNTALRYGAGGYSSVLERICAVDSDDE